MLQTGLSARGFLGGYTSQASKGTATWASPQGPRTATQAGFGTTASPTGGGTHRVATAFLSIGALSLAALVFIWYSLPR